jgi:hypothetical protein
MVDKSDALAMLKCKGYGRIVWMTQVYQCGWDTALSGSCLEAVLGTR